METMKTAIEETIDQLDALCDRLVRFQPERRSQRDPWMVIDQARVYLKDILPEYDDDRTEND